MIAKHVAMNSVQKSHYGELIHYLTDGKGKHERVGAVRSSHCHSERPDAAVLEILNTQAQNIRAASDKTYHLIVSFRAGEQPAAAILEAIEARLCEGLGYDGHQRISVVHDDTDNLHLHIAINKIHPLRYTLHTPYNDHKTLGGLCAELESRYGLEPDNHQARKRGSENRAADLESHAGVESLMSWLRREYLDALVAAPSWEALHRVLNDHGLTLQGRGNGLVIVDGSGVRIKPSTVDRGLSKAKLEARLGAFQAAGSGSSAGDSDRNSRKDGRETGQAIRPPASEPSRCYEPRPVRTRLDTAALFGRYQAEQQQRGTERAEALSRAKARKTAALEAARRGATAKRAAIRLMVEPGAVKKLLYARASQALRDESRRIHQAYLQERQGIAERGTRLTWADWLRREATAGDWEALMALRGREAAQGLKGRTVSATGTPRPGRPVPLQQDSVTKQGTVIYRTGAAVIRDDGQRLKVSRGSGPEALAAALTLALERYGECLSVTGSEAFKDQVVQAAAAAGLPVRFDDAELERRRQSLMVGGMSPDSRQTAQASPEPRPTASGSHPPVVSADALAAADRYIAERNQTRRIITDIPEHRRYQAGDAGELRYGGQRTLDGHSLALLRQGERMLVVPVDEPTVLALRRKLVGDVVTLDAEGRVQSKSQGRSR
ncbi:TraI/MobA(P) family conjugative relaxase [Methylococcus sp. EFPC2]|uniref:TraI/MobA(P) family conjugative relaxase n=1 Tax=Methylococcus sp. EFPC2 TaxID=2812648 RepID=UPI0019684BCE|nr:TraI/MobA(P) family conjugative relaxase [Methylococcus sp. EFPC2]QSA99324.1 relaxase/mobilization nuclease domain-containing protein [Methylococcus sp. EFPC2]